MRCSAVLLAGGKSTRMGRDKAFLEFNGRPLWRHQVETLYELAPAQLMIAGPTREEWSRYDIIADEAEDAGPLAGVAAGLRRCSAPLLVVLAIDLPMMTAAFLRSVLESCDENRGLVPTSSRGLEPLAAIYPRTCAALAAASLKTADVSMRSFARHALEQGWLREHEITPDNLEIFVNLNTPADYEKSRQRPIHPAR